MSVRVNITTRPVLSEVRVQAYILDDTTPTVAKRLAASEARRQLQRSGWRMADKIAWEPVCDDLLLGVVRAKRAVS